MCSVLSHCRQFKKYVCLGKTDLDAIVLQQSEHHCVLSDSVLFQDLNVKKSYVSQPCYPRLPGEPVRQK
jgi:hypothetical protein